jgi:hypothetical protein
MDKTATRHEGVVSGLVRLFGGLIGVESRLELNDPTRVEVFEHIEEVF